MLKRDDRRGSAIPKTLRTSGAVRKSLRRNIANPNLYVDDPLVLVRQR